jgi:hypothetical protein
MSSLTALPKMKRPEGRKRVEKASPAPPPYEDCTVEIEIEQFLRMAPDPIPLLTHCFSVDELFGGGIETYNNEAQFQKKNTLRKLMDMSGSSSTKTESIGKEARALILAQTERLVSHVTNSPHSFTTLFARVTNMRSAVVLTEVYYVCPPLLLDHSVASHPRLCSLGLFDTAYLVENGKLLARTVINNVAMSANWRKSGADNRYKGLLEIAAAHIAKLPFSNALLDEAMPMAWTLHVDSNSALTDRQIEEQNLRIKGEFIFLCFGLLQAMKLREKAEAAVLSILRENGI